MAFVHSKDTVVTIDGEDISEFSNSTTFNRSAKTHDVTTYGTDDEKHHGGLKGGTVTIGGTYEDSVAGPAAVIEPLLGTTVPFVFQVSGVGVGKPKKACDVIVTAFNVSSPVSEMVQWTAELLITGAVDNTPQAA